MKRLLMVCAVAGMLLVTPLVATGTVYKYHNEADFIAATWFPLYMESFEGLPVDNYAFTGRTELTVTDFTLHGVPHDPTEGLSVWSVPHTDQHATDGFKYVTAATIYNLDFELDKTYNAFGLHIIDWGDWGTGTLTYSMNGQAMFTIAVGPLPAGNEIFFGAISTQEFNRVTLSHNIYGESYAIDEVYYGVPEPATICLLGLGGLALLRKRTK